MFTIHISCSGTSTLSNDAPNGITNTGINASAMRAGNANGLARSATTVAVSLLGARAVVAGNGRAVVAGKCKARRCSVAPTCCEHFECDRSKQHLRGTV